MTVFVNFGIGLVAEKEIGGGKIDANNLSFDSIETCIHITAAEMEKSSVNVPELCGTRISNHIMREHSHYSVINFGHFHTSYPSFTPVLAGLKFLFRSVRCP